MPFLRRTLILLLLLAVPLAGCIGGSPQQAPSDEEPKGPPPTPQDPRLPAHEKAPRVVVAVIDTGINVYHDWFQRNASLSDEVLANFVNTLDGAAPERVRLSRTGDYDERLERDEDVWGDLERQKLYYFEGTNVLGISFDQSDHVVLDDSGHGSATSGAVVDANPGAIVVLVESFNADSEAWTASQPWIDVFSMSYGPPGSVPMSGPLVYGLTTHEATRLGWQNGQIPVGAADNSPALSPNDETSGPPWVVGIAGDHEDSGCRDHVSGTFPDFTSDFTQTLPAYQSTDETRSASGTSFATPKSAGTFSAALLEIRRAWGHVGGITDGALALGPDGERLTNAGLREAFNRTATYFAFTDCSPQPGTSLPVNPAAPWLQMGWGHLGRDVVAPTVEHVLGLAPAPVKDEAAVFQGALYAYREQLWSVQ